MDGLMRRKSGVYVARLGVPARFRTIVGKSEMIASTGTRVLDVARIIAGEFLTQWRRRFHDLDRLRTGMDVLQLTTGSPVLSAGSTLPLSDAAKASGIDESQFLRQAAAGRLRLYVRCVQLDGHFFAAQELIVDRWIEGTTFIAPTPEQMPR